MNVSDGQVSVFEKDKDFLFFVDESGRFLRRRRSEYGKETVS